MRKFAALATVCVLAACGGGGSTGGTIGGPLPQATPTATPTAQPSGNQPQFSIAFPANRKSVKGGKHSAFISSAALSVVIDRTAPSTVNGTPQAISAATCTVVTPCTVTGPAWQTGVSNTYTLTTYDASNGTGNALDAATISFTPTAGQTAQAVTLGGIPASATIGNVPSTWQADTQNQTQTLTVTAYDADGEQITGTYGTPIDMYAGDTQTYGTKVTSAHTEGSCREPLLRRRNTAAGFGNCAELTSDTDTVTLNYSGLAENTVTLAAGVAGTSIGSTTFTPVLNAIVADASDPVSTYSPCAATCYGIDLFTSDSSSAGGYTGTVLYKEAGYTDSPYNQQLAFTGDSSCASFATIAAGTGTGGETPITATAIASPAAGNCSVTVTDNLTNHASTPAFEVTYTTFNGGTINAKPGHHKP